jgi:E3 ubiquitin-protein ligase RAD18
MLQEDGLVACPICQKRMKEWQVFSHLESCTGDSTPQPATITTETNVETVLGQSQRQQQKLLERLPALNYSLLKEQLLRKKLAELGISNQGPRPLLERRHKEWMTLWNANCDAAKPKKRNELLRDLDVWERTQGGRAQMSGKSAQNAAIIKDKDFDGAAWAARHESSFKDLVASARQSRSAAAKKKAEDQQASPGDETPQQEQNAHPETTAEAGSSGEVKTETEASPNLIPKTTDGNTAPDAASIPPSNSNDTNLTGADLRGLEKHDVDIKPDVLTPMLCD